MKDSTFTFYGKTWATSYIRLWIHRCSSGFSRKILVQFSTRIISKRPFSTMNLVFAPETAVLDIGVLDVEKTVRLGIKEGLPSIKNVFVIPCAKAKLEATLGGKLVGLKKDFTECCLPQSLPATRVRSFGTWPL